MNLTETNSLRFPVPVADIKAIVTGKDCPHMKEKSALKQNKVSGVAGHRSQGHYHGHGGARRVQSVVAAV